MNTIQRYFLKVILVNLFIAQVITQDSATGSQETQQLPDGNTNNSTNADPNKPEWAKNIDDADVAWVIVASILVMIMTPALGLFYGGLVEVKNMISMLAQCLTIYSITTLAWTLFGFSLVFGNVSNYGLIGGLNQAGLNGVNFSPSDYAGTISYFLFFFYQLHFAAITPALIIGAVAERVRYLPLMLFSFLWHLLVYCPIAHWNWHTEGWLNKLGTKDFAGGNVIHISSGVSALAIVFFLEREPIRKIKKKSGKKETKNSFKKRDSILKLVRTNDMENSVLIETSGSKNSLVFVVIGTMLIWFGWFGFNGGSALNTGDRALMAVVNSNIAPAMSLVVWVILDYIYKGRPTVSGMCIAIVCGLVGITPAAGYVRVWASVVIGAFAVVIPYLFVYYKEKYKFFDDRLDVFGCHGLGGIVGGILTGFFLCDIRKDNSCDPSMLGVVYGNGLQLAYQLIGIFASASYSFVVSYLLALCLNKCMVLTARKNESMDRLEYQESALANQGILIRAGDLHNTAPDTIQFN
jgi:Amt family ammonium transporter